MTSFRNTVLAGGVALISFAAPAVAATFTLNGTIYDYGHNGSSVDLWTINADVDGQYQFDVLSRFVLDGDGPFGVSWLDPFVRLFNYDAAGDLGQLGAQVGYDDDGYSAGYGDGSVSALDSFLDIFLTSGTYVLAIGDYYLSESEARHGFNNSGFFGSYADYQITVTTPEPSVVPLPASLPLLAAAFGGLAFLRRKRRKA